MNKINTYLAIIALLSVSICVVPTEGVSIEQIQSISPRSSNYKKLDTLLQSLHTQINNEIKITDSNIKKTNKQRVDSQRNLNNLQKDLKKYQRNLNIAQNNFNHYNRLKNTQYSELQKLYKSIQIQKNYMNLERHYVDRIHTESHKFKHYPKEYKQIVNEVNELRRKLNIGLNDVNIAYKKLLSKISSQHDSTSRNKNKAQITLTNNRKSYNILVGKYNQFKRSYNSNLNTLQKRLETNIKLKGELTNELNLLIELRELMKSYNPSYNSNNKYRKDYIKILNKYNTLVKNIIN